MGGCGGGGGGGGGGLWVGGVPCGSTREDLPIDVSITNVGLILTKIKAISFLGVRTDRHGFGILTWKHVCTQKISTQSSKLVVSCRSLYAFQEKKLSKG